MHTSSHFLRYWALKELRSFDESSKQLVKIYFFKKHYLSVEVQPIPHEAANGAQQGLFLIVLLLLLLFVSYSFPWVNEISANKRPPVSSPLAAMQVEIRHMKMRSGGINFIVFQFELTTHLNCLLTVRTCHRIAWLHGPIQQTKTAYSGHWGLSVSTYISLLTLRE